MVFVLCCKRHFSRQFCSAAFSRVAAYRERKQYWHKRDPIYFISYCREKVFKMNILFSSWNKMSNNDKVSWAKKLFLLFSPLLIRHWAFCECETLWQFVWLIYLSPFEFRDDYCCYEPFFESNAHATETHQSLIDSLLVFLLALSIVPAGTLLWCDAPNNKSFCASLYINQLPPEAIHNHV